MRKELIKPAVFVSAMLLSPFGQAAVHVNAVLDLSGIHYTKSNASINTSLALTVSQTYYDYSTHSVFHYYDGTYHDDGGQVCTVTFCEENIHSNKPGFPSTVVRSLHGTQLSSSMTQQEIRATVDQASPGTSTGPDTPYGLIKEQNSLYPNNYARLYISGAGTVTMRIPYTLELSTTLANGDWMENAYASVNAQHLELGDFTQPWIQLQEHSDSIQSEFGVAQTISKSGVVEFTFTSDEAQSEHILLLRTLAGANVTAVPEPESYAMMGMGLAGILLARRARKNVCKP